MAVFKDIFVDFDAVTAHFFLVSKQKPEGIQENVGFMVQPDICHIQVWIFGIGLSYVNGIAETIVIFPADDRGGTNGGLFCGLKQL